MLMTLKTGNLFWCEVINNASVELLNVAYVLTWAVEGLMVEVPRIVTV